MLFMDKFNFTKEDLVKSKRRFYLIGGLMLFMGFVSLSMPLLASFAIETLVGGLLLAVGFAQALGAFRGFSDGDKPWQQTFMAVISLAAGFIFFAHPLAGVATLSMLLSFYFMFDGIMKIMEYFRLRSIGGSLWILLSGALGVILAVMMWKNVFTGASMIGILLGVNLIFSGMSFILLGRGCSEASKKDL